MALPKLSLTLSGCYYIICHGNLSLDRNFLQSEKSDICFPTFSHAQFGVCTDKWFYNNDTDIT